MFPLKDEIRPYSFPIVSYLIILVNTLVFIYQYFFYPDPNEFILKYGFIPREFSFMDIITSMFIHGGFFHIFSNMLFLFIFGDNVEDVMGHLRFLFFYIIWGFCAVFLQTLFYSDSNIPMVGASGAISGVLGAYLVFFPFSKIISFVFIPFIYIGIASIPAIIYLGIWFINQFIQGTLSTLLNIHVGVAFWAHIGGFVGGLITGVFFYPFKRQYIRGKRRRYYFYD
ncbi:MAG: rhomboid family intramembrane serine protease [candidate division WOR-3 bacterium]|nr:rhomboid family intramembrane serine protease [candidate division WOR-3 bacterium]MCX7947917.1 rhomboid family intramembrane serine protease [candidate division WOR-3 bacterium]MDW8150861.1 rhomboid family intramembrane serine protease [candidate division WOR-3 bacterium]